MKLNKKQLQIIHDETMRVYPNEAVIGITKTSAIPLDNIHENPILQFKVDSEAFYKKNFIALVHSHTDKAITAAETYNIYWDIRAPSKLDQITQKNMDIPFGIIGYDGENLTDVLWFPDLETPIEGRPFIWGVYDCYELVRSWYWQNHKVLLNATPREFDWKEIELLITQTPDFDILDRTTPLEIGDVLVTKVGCSYDSHVGVYIGEGKWLHHLTNRLPQIDNVDKHFPYTTKILRLKNESST